MRQVQQALADIGIPVYAGVWRASGANQNPPPQYVVYSTTTVEAAHEDDHPSLYRTYVYLKANASSDPKVVSGKLRGAISTGKVKKHKRTGLHITIGVHRKDWDDEDYYPAYVEYGHGGPAPAPTHPYVRPAFDARQDEAFGIIRDGLLQELKK